MNCLKRVGTTITVVLIVYSLIQFQLNPTIGNFRGIVEAVGVPWWMGKVALLFGAALIVWSIHRSR